MNKNPDTEYVATLIASRPASLARDLLRKAASHVEKSGGLAVRTSWLEEETAADIFCTFQAPETLRTCLVDFFKEQPFDFIVQPVMMRRKKLLLADMESTIIEQEMLDELADMIGRREDVAAITRRAMNGEIDFAGALRERVMMLKGQPAALIDRAAKRITPMLGAETLIRAMKSLGNTCWLVSGGFTCFADAVAATLGFDRVYANTLEVGAGLLTGKVLEPILDREAKKALLEKACIELQILPHDVLAIGDGANDIPMLAACNAGGGLGVAFRAKPHVREVIPHQLNHTGLDALLYAQGLQMQMAAFDTGF